MSKTLEELGYEKDGEYTYRKQERWIECVIWFDWEDKSVISEYRYIDDDEWKSMSISMEELKAIYKWCEEQGWI